jgi:hypothetical protein
LMDVCLAVSARRRPKRSQTRDCVRKLIRASFLVGRRELLELSTRQICTIYHQEGKEIDEDGYVLQPRRREWVEVQIEGPSADIRRVREADGRVSSRESQLNG